MHSEKKIPRVINRTQPGPVVASLCIASLRWHRSTPCRGGFTLERRAFMLGCSHACGPDNVQVVTEFRVPMNTRQLAPGLDLLLVLRVLPEGDFAVPSNPQDVFVLVAPVHVRERRHLVRSPFGQHVLQAGPVAEVPHLRAPGDGSSEVAVLLLFRAPQAKAKAK